MSTASPPISPTDSLEALEERYRRNQLVADIAVQEAQLESIRRAVSLDKQSRSLGGAGGEEALEALYDPEDYVDYNSLRNENYSYMPAGAGFSTKTDRKDGQNYPYWQTESELSAIRGITRLLCTYNKTCIGVLNKVRNYVVAQGFARKVVKKDDQCPRRLRDTVERVLDEFDSRNRITGELDQEVVVRDVRDGEAPSSLWHRGEGIVDLRIVEPDQISEPTNKEQLEEWLLAGTDGDMQGYGLPFVSNWSFGVHSTKGDVCDVHGYYVQWDCDETNWDYLPGGPSPCYPPATLDNTWLELRKSNTDRNVKRGVSDFWALGGDVELARKMIRNLTHAGALQTAIAWIREMQPGITASQVTSATMATADYSTRSVTNSGASKTTYHRTYGPGTELAMGANQKFTSPPWMNQSVAGAMIGIFEGMLRSVGQIWSFPEHMITGSAANNNYASILEAGSPFVKEIETRQGWHIAYWTAIYWKVVWWNWRVGKFGNVPWEYIRSAVEIRLTGPQVDVRNRLQETQRNQILYQLGVMSKQTLCSREALDYDDEAKQGLGGQQPAGPETPGLPAPGETGLPSPETPQAGQAPTPSPETPSTSDNPDTPDNAKLNGAQVSSSIQILAEVVQGTMVPTAAVGLLVAVGINRPEAQKMVDETMQSRDRLAANRVEATRKKEAAKQSAKAEPGDLGGEPVTEAWTDEAREKPPNPTEDRMIRDRKRLRPKAEREQERRRRFVSDPDDFEIVSRAGDEEDKDVEEECGEDTRESEDEPEAHDRHFQRLDWSDYP